MWLVLQAGAREDKLKCPDYITQMLRGRNGNSLTLPNKQAVNHTPVLLMMRRGGGEKQYSALFVDQPNYHGNEGNARIVEKLCYKKPNF